MPHHGSTATLTIHIPTESFIRKQLQSLRAEADRQKWIPEKDGTIKEVERLRNWLIHKTIVWAKPKSKAPNLNEINAHHLGLLAYCKVMHCGEATAYAMEKFLSAGCNNFFQVILTDNVNWYLDHSLLVFFMDMEARAELLKVAQSSTENNVGSLMKIPNLIIFDLFQNLVGSGLEVGKKFNPTHRIRCAFEGCAFDLAQIRTLQKHYLTLFAKLQHENEASSKISRTAAGAGAGAAPATTFLEHAMQRGHSPEDASWLDEAFTVE